MNLSTKKLIQTGHYLELVQYEHSYLVPSNQGLTKTARPVRDVYNEPNEMSVKSSANRAKNKVNRLILGNMHTNKNTLKFVTLTFADEVTDLDSANYELKKFRQRLSYHLGEKLQYIAVPEIQEKRKQTTGKAVWHYHLMTINLPYMNNEELATIWTNGFTKPKRVYKEIKCVNYLTKYLSKSYKDRTMRFKKRYYNSLPYQPRTTNNQTEIVEIYNRYNLSDCVIKSYPLKDYQGTEIGKKSTYYLNWQDEPTPPLLFEKISTN